jgi:hypothetical protein
MGCEPKVFSVGAATARKGAEIRRMLRSCMVLNVYRVASEPEKMNSTNVQCQGVWM